MARTTIITGFIFLLLFPLEAAAFWLGEDGQCFTDTALPADVAEPVSGEVDPEDDCETVDPSDPSSNVCFEDAANPISTLPELLAESQAEQVVAGMLAGAADIARAAAEPQMPSPSEASVENPEAPGQPLVERPIIPNPKRAPNSCSVYPEDCEQAPIIPTLNLEASGPQAREAGADLDVDPPPVLDEQRRGPPNTGVGPSAGVFSRVERPPEMA